MVTDATTSRVSAGFVFSKRCPLRESTHLPAMKFRTMLAMIHLPKDAVTS
jgi:hypothetical protein